MSDGGKAVSFVIGLLIVFMITILFKFNIVQAEPEKEVKPVRPEEVNIQEQYQKKLPKKKRINLNCNPKIDIYHTPSCIIV